MTATDIRKLGSRVGLADTPADDDLAKAYLAFDAFAGLYEAAKLNHHHHYAVNGCSTCEALARVEAL